MTRNSSYKNRIMAMVGLSLLLSVSAVVLAQEGGRSPARVRGSFQAGQDCYSRGDYAAAAELFLQVQANLTELTPVEQQDLQALIRINNIALQSQRDGQVKVKQAEDALRQGRTQEAAALATALNANQYLTPADKKLLGQLSERLRAGKGAPPTVPTVKAAPPKEKSKSFMATIAAPFHTVKSFITGSPSNSDKIEPIESGTAVVIGPSTNVGPDLRPPDQGPTTANPPNPTTVRARELLQLGREALEKKEYAKAKQYADQAQALRADLPWWDTPDKLLAEIRQRAPELVPATALDPKNQPHEKADPRALLREGRTLLLQGKLDEADAFATRALAQPARWGLFEDSPTKLRSDIQRLRAKQDKAEAGRLLVEARKQFKQGHLDEAKTLAQRADKLHGPYSMWDLGDRPQKLLAEVRVAEAKLGKLPPKNHQPKENPLAKDNRNDKKVGLDDKQPPPPAAMVHMEAKDKAKWFLNEAYKIGQTGNLLGARQQLLEAQKWAAEAAKGGVHFAANEESPDDAMKRLAGICDSRISALLMHVETGLLSKSNDPRRFHTANAQLNEAYRLAQEFGHDLGKIEQKAAWARQLQGLPAVPQNVALTDKQKQGLELLDKARLELRHGQTQAAFLLAQQACQDEYGIQEAAQQMLRSIGAEEHNQKIMAANRMFDEAHDALSHRDYRKAATIFATLDERLLTQDRQKRLREIALPHETGSGQLIQVGAQALAQPSVPGTARVSDMHPVGPGSKSAGLENMADRFKGMEEVLFQQLRDESLNEQKRAMNSANAGDLDRALETLRLYLLKLDDSSLAPERAVLLRKPVERKMQEYTTRRAQQRFEEQQRAGLLDGRDLEKKRVLDKEKVQNQIVDLVKQANDLMRQGKFREARVRYEQVRELDPDNLAAQAGIFQAEIEHGRDKFARINKGNAEMRLNALSHDLGPYVDTPNPVAMSKEGVERGKLRDKDYGNGIKSMRRDPIEREIERKLSNPISFNYKDAPLSQVIEDLNGMSGINVIPDDAAFQEMGIITSTRLTMRVDNIPMKSALTILLKKVGLTYMIKDHALQITTPEHAQGVRKLVTYSVADLIVPVENHSLPVVSDMNYILARHLETRNRHYGPSPYANPYGLPNGQPVSSSSGSQGSQAQANGSGHNQRFSAEETRSRVPRTLEDQLINLITNTVEPQSWRDMGGKGTIQWYPLGMALTISQTPDIQEQIVDLLNALRRLQDVEVAIEMRLVSVSESFFERIGLDFDVNINNNNSRFEPQLLASSFRPPGFINTFKPDTFVAGLTPAGTFTSDLGIPLRNSSFDFSIPPFGGFPGTLGADGGLSLGLAFLSDFQVFMFMEAAQGDRRTNIMQAPKITVFNGQTAFITVNDSLFFLSQIDVDNINGIPVFTPVQTPFPIGISLSVNPVVSADRRFVRLFLSPFLTSVTSASVPLLPFQVTVPQTFEPGIAPAGQDRIFQYFLQQPNPSTISLATTVVIPDGGTVLLGGLKTLAEARNEFGPPILSKIPYINRLFRNVGYGREAQSLMIMVTARIIINEEEERIYLGLQDPIPR